MNKTSHAVKAEIQLSWSQAQRGQNFTKVNIILTYNKLANKKFLYYVLHKAKVLKKVSYS